MSNLLTIWEFIGKHKYLITVLAFAAIIGFLDENSAIRRIGYDRWIRNIAVALGNALRDMENESVRDAIVHALNEKKSTVSKMVDEHIVWAMHQGS